MKAKVSFIGDFVNNSEKMDIYKKIDKKYINSFEEILVEVSRSEHMIFIYSKNFVVCQTIKII